MTALTRLPPAEGHGTPGESALARIRHALAPLFPVAEAARWCWPSAVLAGLAVVAGTAVSLGRQGGPGALRTVWAEDGANLLTDALNRSTVDALRTPINGYFHVVTRLLAEVTAFFPVERAAAVMSTAAALTCAVLGLIVYLAASAHVRSVLVRLLLSVPLVLAPVGLGGLGYHGGSVVDNLATLQFPLLYGAFWLVLWAPASRAGRVAVVVVLLLLALSSPLAVIYLPLAAGRLLVRRDPAGIGLLCALLAGAVLQFGGLAAGWTSRAQIGQTRADPLWIGAEYVRWLAPNALLGERWWLATVGHSHWRLALVVAAWLVVGAAVVAGLRRLTAPRWHVAVAAFVTSLVLTGVQLGTLGATADRYLFAPGLLLLAAVALLLVPVRPGWSAAVPAAVLAVLLTVSSVVNWHLVNHRSFARNWYSVVAEARARCAGTGADRVTVTTHTTITGWTVTIPCRRLR